MVHSVVASAGAVFALQNERLVKYGDDKQMAKTVEADLVKIKAAGDRIVGLVNGTKQARVYDLDLHEIATHEFPKRPSAFAVHSHDLVAADKFGDVFRAALESPTDPKNLPTILGHMSVVLDAVLLERYIITGDRDEHIRVSRFPQSFVIEQFLLGHTAFVSHLAVHDDILVSGGGDSFVLVWNWKTGEQLGKIDVGCPVIALETAGGEAYIVPQDSTEVLVADLRTQEIRERRAFNENVTCLAVQNADILVGLANRVSGFAELPGHTDPISEESLRKTNVAP